MNKKQSSLPAQSGGGEHASEKKKLPKPHILPLKKSTDKNQNKTERFGSTIGVGLIRAIQKNDRELFLCLSEAFYRSEGVLHEIPAVYHEQAFNELMRSNDYAEAYIIECDGKSAGYLLAFKCYSREAGGMMLWLDELYILPEFQSRGLGREALAYMETKARKEGYARIRLEVERNNVRARSLYERLGFVSLEYEQMIKDLNGVQN